MATAKLLAFKEGTSIGMDVECQTVKCWSNTGNTKGGSINVPLTSCLIGLESAVWQLTIFVFICKTD
jgi:hypothetical protein